MSVKRKAQSGGQQYFIPWDILSFEIVFLFFSFQF